MQGRVKFFQSPGYWGFISVDGHDDVFLHMSNVIGDIPPSAGDIVEFEIGHNQRHPEKTMAINVRIVA
jgi:cold shock CspA family protein